MKTITKITKKKVLSKKGPKRLQKLIITKRNLLLKLNNLSISLKINLKRKKHMMLKWENT
jgi:hypothetical protein